MTVANLHLLDPTTGRWQPALSSGGAAVGGGSGGGSVASAGWQYAAASGGITRTSDVQLSPAQGASKSNYLSALQIMNGAAGATTEVVIKDGSTVIWREVFVASAGISVKFDPPLFGSANKALNAACITTAAAIYLNAQGFVTSSPTSLADRVTPEDELRDDNGDNILDDNNAQIYVISGTQ